MTHERKVTTKTAHKLNLLAVALVGALLATTHAQAQQEPLGGQLAPGAKASVKDFEEQVAHQRGFEAVVWSQPAEGVYGIRRGMFAIGAKDNEIMAMSRPLAARHEFLTANNTTGYVRAARPGRVKTHRCVIGGHNLYRLLSNSYHGVRTPIMCPSIV
jgi:hypothetical protein